MTQKPWMTCRIYVLSALLSASFGMSSCTLDTAKHHKTNVLFIVVDDLNDWVGVMGGHPQAITPNIDRLANSGMLFTNAHCQAPICAPSRASVMTGLYPTTSGHYLQMKDENIKKTKGIVQRATFLPDYFEQHGYKTMGVGKIYHVGDRAKTFDEYGGVFEKFGPKPPERFHYDPQWFGKPGGTQTDWGAFPDADSLMPDAKSAAWAIEKLEQDHETPFFLGVGFIRPHVPWYVPEKWFEKFPLEEVQTPPYRADDMDDVPELGRQVAAVPAMPTTEWAIENGQWKKAVQAYLACVYFVDAQIGKVLDALEDSQYAENTVVILWSDHGYHVGEKNRFAKQALWERDTKSVLIFREPGAEPNRRSHKPVQLLDIYPTLLELCGLPPNQMNEGHSLVPLLKGPNRDDWPYLSISSYGRNNTAVTSEQFRLIQYEDGSMEFYDLMEDPNEWNNLARSGKYEQEMARLEKYIPCEQAELSEYSGSDINAYFARTSGGDK